MKYIHSLYIGLLSLLFIGCQEEQLNNMQTGGFQISLQDVAADITTKTLPKDLEGPLVSNFQLKITNEVSGSSIYNGAYTSNLIPASTGIYTISATHGDNPPLAKDDPYYKGDTTGVELEEDQVASVELKCRVANALASVVYTSEAMFKEVFTDYGVKVGIGNLTVDLENGTTESAYYQAGSIPTFTFVGTLKGNGKEVTKVLEDTKLTDPSIFAAGQHCKITLSLSTTTAGVNLDIEKVEATPVTITATIPMEWLPKPKVEAEGFIDNTLTFVETETPEASIKLSTASALQDMRLKFHFEDPQFEALNRDTGYLYSNPADKDIINTTLGISLSDENKIDLYSLLDKLQTNAGEVTTNTIEIDAKANDRWSSEVIEGQETPNLKYTLVCNKPEFTVSVYPGNIWTKEFTMNALMEDQVTEGDFSKLSANMKYQFSTNGESDWTDLGEDLRKADLVPGTTYYVRGVYRNEVCSNPVAVSTYPIIELENGELEGARITRGDDTPGFFGTNYGALFEWDKWATLNAVSACYCLRTAYSFNSRSGCRPTNDAVSGNAIRVITLGYKGGGWAVPEAAMHSELYLGTSADDDGNRSYGISFNSKPTALKFQYKCIENVPGNDVSLVQIQVFHDDILLGEGRFTTGTQNSYVQKSLEIIYENESENLNLEPNKLFVLFKSGVKENLNWETDLKNFNTGGTTDKTEDATFRGNELFVDEVSLVYDK